MISEKSKMARKFTSKASNLIKLCFIVLCLNLSLVTVSKAASLTSDNINTDTSLELKSYPSDTFETKSVSKDKFISPLCVNVPQPKIIGPHLGPSVGCVAESLIPMDKANLIEFQDPDTSDDPNLCLKTCNAVYPNTSLAMVSWEQHSNKTLDTGGLDCYCGMADSLSLDVLGPNIFCKNICHVKNKVGAISGQAETQCGGSHVFEGGSKEVYFNVYCLVTGTNGTVPPVPTMPPVTVPPTTTTSSTTTTAPSTTTEGTTGSPPTDDSINKLLRSIWYSLVNTNVVSIIIIFLLCLVIILVIIVCTWAWLFVKNLDPTATAAFYRGLSRRKPGNPKQPILNNPMSPKPTGNGVNNQLPSQNENGDQCYGTRNQAFDPDVENDPDGLSAMRCDTIFAGEMAPNHTSTSQFELTPPATATEDLKSSPPADFVLKMGKSKFYQRSSRDDLDKSTDDDLDDDDQTIDTDTVSRTSVETAETLPAKDATLNQNDPE